MAELTARLVADPQEHVLRSDLGGDKSARPAKVLLRILHATDLHMMDAGSPARCEWIEARGQDPLWQPLLHMARPYDPLVNWGVTSMVAAINASGAEHADLAIFTGDNVDNCQFNEVSAYLSALDGGTFQFPYWGPQCLDWAGDPRLKYAYRPDGTWAYWLPDGPNGGAPLDHWTRDGFPSHPGLLEEASTQISSPGIGLPWLPVLGNHDVLRQGTSKSTPRLESIATGARKHFGPTASEWPEDPVASFLRDPTPFHSTGPIFTITPDAGRNAIDTKAFIAMHLRRADHRGFVDPTRGDYVYDAGAVLIVVLDTNHPYGHFQGSVGASQLAWLDDELSKADVSNTPVVVASHHGSVSLVNTVMPSADRDSTELEERLHGQELESVLLRHGCVVGWLTGHRHVHRIRPVKRPGGVNPGFWEIATSSLIDFPCQVRAVDIVQFTDDSIGLRTTNFDHNHIDVGASDRQPRLGAIHKQLASLVAGVDSAYPGAPLRVDTLRVHDSAARRLGEATDRNTVLIRPSGAA